MGLKSSLLLGGLMSAFSTIAGCGGAGGPVPIDRPEMTEVTPAVDINPDPRIFETTITAAPHQLTLDSGEIISVFAYNGQVPGPEIRVKRGDRVIVHFKNELPEGYASTLHWHGIELNNQSDGTEHSQAAVHTGETYVYDFIAPRAGVFWYHPHVRGAEKVAAGLYAPLIVTQPEEEQLVQVGKLPSKDVTVVLSDLSVEDGALRDLNKISAMETMNGTEGNVLLVNGKEFPRLSLQQGEGIRLRLINASIARYYRLSLPGHQIYRVGGQSGLLPNVVIEGGPVQAMRMPMDESYTGFTGAVEVDQGFERGEILLAPAERADVVIVPKVQTGESLVLQWVDFARGRHMMGMPHEAAPGEEGTPPHHATAPDEGTVMHGHGDTTKPDDSTALPGGHADMGMTQAQDDGLRPSIDLLRIDIESGSEVQAPFQIDEGDQLVQDALPALEPERSEMPITLQEDMEAMMAGAPKSTWFKIDDYSGVEGRTNYRTATVGEIVEWQTHNDTEMYHPFHLHGFSFQPTHYMRMNHEDGYMDVWRINEHHEFFDTINVPPHTSVFYTFEVSERPDFGADPDSSTGNGALGDWMFHCHMLQHGENGMMSFLRVE